MKIKKLFQTFIIILLGSFFLKYADDLHAKEEKEITVLTGPRWKDIYCTYKNGELIEMKCSGIGDKWCDCPN